MPDTEHHHGDHAEREAARHGRDAHRHEMRFAKDAREEVSRVKDELAEVCEKKDIHVHNTHEWMHKLSRASKRLLRDHEEELDNAEKSAAWVNDALDAINDANKQAIAMAKAIPEASGHRTAKDADFEKAAIADKAKAMQADLDKALSLIPQPAAKA